ncbi:MAG: hypothetical protein QNK37_28055 [Acidobacteriota bacterium]|nr:hypothetical protein [Acidobacteriota bacterium]
MYRKTIGTLIVFLALALSASAQSQLLPEWTTLDGDRQDTLRLSIPSQMSASPQVSGELRYLVLELDAGWSADWRQAAFDLKNLIITLKTRGPSVKVGVLGTRPQIDGLLNHELAPYFDGYIYDDEPYLPGLDQTGKLWQRVTEEPASVLGTLVDAASIGTQVVLFQGVVINDAHAAFLNRIAQTDTGSLDIQPQVNNFSQDQAQFFFDPNSGNYHLAVYADAAQQQAIAFSLAKDMKVTALYPEDAPFRTKQFGRRTEIYLSGGQAYYFFLLEPAEKTAQSERIEIRGRSVVDPYELVVKNQVFKDAEAQKFRSLEVDEDATYRYQVAGGFDIDITFRDTLIIRKDKPLERLRRELFIGGARWPYKKKPEFPLIQPEKVKRIPLTVDLDKTYSYSYRGEDTVNGAKTWRVRFKPKQEGANLFSGTVWIDQQTGAHRKLTARQTGMEAPVIANEITAFFDWQEDGGQRYWTQVAEKSLQVLSIGGAQISLVIDSKRYNYRFNRDNTDQVVEEAYASDVTILRDTDDGLRYMVKKKDGSREIAAEENFSRARAIPGGILKDDDSVVPLLGYNYTSLDFLKRGWQANFFVAGAVNDLLVTNPNFLDRGWDFTAELFATAIHFEDEVYDGVDQVDELTVQTLRQSLNFTLGIPLNGFTKLSFNYGLGFNGFKEGDDMNQEGPNGEPVADFYTLPEDHLEHTGRVDLTVSWKRLSSRLQFEQVKRGDWEPFGLESGQDPLFDSFRKLTFDTNVSRQLDTFKTIGAEFSYLKGWDLDRFSRFDFGFFGNSVAGFSSSGIEADEALIVSLEYEFGVSDLLNLEVQLDGARAMLDDPESIPYANPLETVDFYGIGVAANFIGPWRSVLRVNMGYGLDADLEDAAGDWNGQILFLKLF